MSTIAKFVKMQNASGRYAIFQIPGHKGRIYVDTKLFVDGVTPAELSPLDNMVAAQEGAPVSGTVDAEKAAAAAAKAQEKADKAQAKATAAAEKAQARVAKAQAAAAAAVARAQKASGAPAAEAQPEL